MQSKLLRVIQERAVRPIGAVAETPLNVRIVSATHKDLGAEVLAGRFRQDLFYRLNVIEVRLPPLRQRRDDIPLLVEHILRRFAKDHGKPFTGITPAAAARLEEHDFPGNVRELENIIERAMILARGAPLGIAHLDFGRRGQTTGTSTPKSGVRTLVPNSGW